ncbi:Transcription elongation factor family protein, putative isoform 2 [Hibiscus syriacus]|uniref:Transcription elongation factor family protein, putative isoform 2 n=1 Tax=Hibiscus syriacus TaxID=106335 RepID=A0A6A2YRB6_HIBSY|nr:Transcription elongation factor family protein, putative isoform 2 [Hibiscus syriacus]
MIVGEVFRIIEILHNCQDEPDSVLYESLRKLQLMDLTVDILEATGIRKAVNRVRKHSSKQIRNLAQTLIDGWKELVEEWVSATNAVAGFTPESMNPSVADEDDVQRRKKGFHPPLDIGALFATQPTSMELSQQTSSEANLLPKDDTRQQMKRQEPVAKPNNKPSRTNVVSGRPPKHNIEQKAYNEPKSEQKPNKMVVPKRPLCDQEDVSETITLTKARGNKKEATRAYKQVENAKRKRTIQMMELHDPKAGSGHKNPYLNMVTITDNGRTEGDSVSLRITLSCVSKSVVDSLPSFFHCCKSGMRSTPINGNH